METALNQIIIKAIRKRKVLNKKLDAIIDDYKTKGESLCSLIIQNGIITDKEMLSLLSIELSIPPIELSKYKLETETCLCIPEKLAKQYKIVALSKLGSTLTVAMADPTNIIAEDDIKAVTGLSVYSVLALENDINNAILKIYSKDSQSEISNIISEEEDDETLEVIEEESMDISEISQESNKAPIVKLVSMILNEALSRRASDIHIEPQEKFLRVRYRVDGRLQESLNIPKKNQNAIIARLKIMSKMDITENRAPQDGRFKIKFREREIDFRVSVLPITYGNKIVLRALDRSSLSVGLDALGYLPEPLADFNKAIKKPYGMILITGPTGSGKSTTLYSIINQINTIEKNIITIEDPVEYQLDGITQIAVNADIGLTFSEGLRSVLRQSPDIIMVGEIRDSETADIAIKAALTGQLVLSTLHTNDAPSAVTRLMDMGIEPFLISSSLIMTAAQRLCRKICPYCKEEYTLPETVLKQFGKEISKYTDKKTFYHGRGCDKCNNTGYLGRMGTLETFFMTNEIKEMIMKKYPSDKLKEHAVKNGMLTLRNNAMRKFVQGSTTLEEVLRITAED